jgi:hypothetical protein
MNNNNTTGKAKFRSALQKCRIDRLIVKPVVAEIRRQRNESLKLSGRILDTVKKIDESIEIIAREIKRQGERSK